MLIFELAALAAAALWAFGGLLSARPSRHLGAIHFNRIRASTTALMLALLALVTGGWGTISLSHGLPLVLSGLIGVFIGDTVLFLALNRLGPRRTSILFSMNAPMGVVLGWLVLEETLSALALSGIAVSLCGIVLAIVFGKRKSQLHQWETIRGPLWIGVGLGLAAALAQAVGALIARPVMEAGADPVAASAIRLAVAAVGVNALVQFRFRILQPANALKGPIFIQTVLSGFISMGLGMTLLLFALSGGEVGIVSTLSATSPALMLPLIWLRTGERPATVAWMGAALACAGTGMIFLG